ncbi:MAG: hypothetical protein M3345_01450 [Actinomycetota bacterium]|nr:hypothetical protein [Actinomycetota bacterium]
MSRLDPSSETVRERFARPLERGVLVFRWVWLVWLTAVAGFGSEAFSRPWLAWTSIAVAGAWTTWLTVGAHRWDERVLGMDLGICAWMIVASAIVVPDGALLSSRPFFAAGYPMSAALLWGVARGPWAGAIAAVVLGVAQLASRPLNGVALSGLTAAQSVGLTGAVLNYLVAGVAVGLVSRLLTRSEEKVQTATEELVGERERAARLAERESLARQIHDSVLQALALVHKRGRELAARDRIPPDEVAQLSEIAGRQEVELRRLILREPQGAPTGSVSLRDALERVGRDLEGVPVTVSTVGAIWIEAHDAQEIAAATKQALENVRQHAGASRASVFAEHDASGLSVSIRDDGRGFVYDEGRLRADDKAGILKSMKGRIEDLGGTMSVDSEPGRGTEIEFRLPADGAERE